MKILDLSNWKRREHFAFFSQYDEPYFGIVSEVDCTIAYKYAKENNISFFAYYLHKSMMAVNQVEEFRYRIDGKKVIIYDQVHSGSTIGRNDGTFAFSFVKFNSDFNIFHHSLNKEINEVQKSDGLRLNDNGLRKDLIHYSSIPWYKFTGLSHARNFKIDGGEPKIVFGKAFIKDDKMIMPTSIHAHHGLMDGIHVAKYLELFQRLLDGK